MGIDNSQKATLRDTKTQRNGNSSRQITLIRLSLFILLSGLVTTAIHCSFHCGTNPSNRIKLPIQSDKSAAEVQTAVQQALPEIKAAIQEDLIQTFPEFDIASTEGTWFSVSRGSAILNGKDYSYCELVIRLKYDGRSPSFEEVRNLLMKSARSSLEKDGWTVVPVNSLGFPVFDQVP
ncbi:MAG: hypothetical protein RH862_04735 [Leptospiraceae bacterium]